MSVSHNIPALPSIRQMQGSMSRQNVADPGAFSRANYMKVLGSYAVRAATI